MKVIVEFTLDETWEDYKDCSDEMVFTDLKETNFQGYSDVKLIKIERI